jgi:hypothetical protein
MSRRISVAPLLTLIIAGTAMAQSPEGTVQTPKPAEGTPPTTPPTDARGEPQGQLDANGNYTIKNGDTLWDLSQQFLNNPWYWPKIWADNPAVENPHWIYPGNRLKISQKGEGSVSVVKPGEKQSDDEEDDSNRPTEEEPLTTNKDPGSFSAGRIDQVGKFAKDSELVSMGGSTPVGLSLVPKTERVHVSSVITDRELSEAGTITHSIEQKSMLSSYDKVYCKINDLADVKIGTTYTIFRTGDKIMHPVTGVVFGYQTRLIGTLDIIGKTANEAIGQIGSIEDGVLRGDHLALNASLDKTVTVSPNESDVTGVILVNEVPALTVNAEDHVVFIDKGASDGVRDGNTFTVVQVGDGLERLRLPGHRVDMGKGPPEPVATLVVFNVGEHSSAAMVVKSLREVFAGDRVEMRRATTASTPGAGGDVR